MKFGLVHLSDIHLKPAPATNSILARAGALRAAIRQRVIGLDACILIMSGDTAQAGLSTEYAIAIPFFSELLIGLAQDIAPKPIQFAIIPGNHDCDFKSEIDLRRIILSNVASTPFKDTSPIDQCLAIQEPFRNFASALQAQCTRVACVPLLSWFDFPVLDISEKHLKLQLFNSAWTSQLKEQPGTLTFPTHLLPPLSTPLNQPDLVVSVIHHPLNWFDPTHRRELARYLENTSDVILTGHEHIPGFSSKQTYPGPNNEYLEGGVLQESSRPDDSTFNILQIDLDTSTQITETFSWNKNERMYRSPTEPALARHFQRNHHRLRSTLPFSSEFDEWLHDPGVHLTHPTKQTLLLDDIFVHPDFQEVSTAESDEMAAIVPGDEFLETVVENKHVVVFGGEIAGKTTLAKVLIQQLKARGIVPLYLGPESHGRLRKHSIQDVCEAVAVRQYEQSQLDRFQQLSSSERAIIVDDYQMLPFDAAARQAFLTEIAAANDLVVLLATDDVRLEEFAPGSSEILSLWEFKHLELLEFGFAKRSELCRKWHGSNIKANSEMAALQSLLANIEKQLSAVLGDKVIPAHPLFLLMLLQQLDIASKDHVVAGSQGYLYQAMVIRDLERASTRNADIDTNKNYLAEFAYRLFCDGISQLPLPDFEIWHRQYCDRYRLTLDCDTQLAALSNEGLLTKAGGIIRFHYPYHFYYFVAEYLAAHISEEHVKRDVRMLTTFFHQTQAANIVLFLCYKSRDRVILDAVCDTARNLFDDHAICQLGDDVKTLPFVVDAADIPIDASDLGDRNPETNRQLVLVQSDAMARSQPAPEDEFAFGLTLETACDLKKLNDQLKLSSALKTIQIIGQILKNHVGSLEGNVKADLVAISTSLGLRAVHSVVTALKDSLEGMVQLAVLT